MEDSGVLGNALKPALQRKKWEAGVQYLLTSIVQTLPLCPISSYQQDIDQLAYKTENTTICFQKPV